MRFKLLTNWNIAPTDPLRPLVNQSSKTLSLEKICTRTDRSAVGKLRKLWREHLSINDTELRYFARTLALDSDSTSLEDHRTILDVLLDNRGLRRIPESESSFLYDDLVYQWLGQGRLEFDRESFRDACVGEGLFDKQGKVLPAYGVKWLKTHSTASKTGVRLSLI